MNDDVTLYCVRHGQTDWNAEERYQGQQDVPLNDIGRAQARRNGEVLRALLPGLAEAHFVSSPLCRAMETMRLVREALGLAPGNFATDERLKEVHYGDWEGQLLATLQAKEPEGIAARQADPFHFRPPSGESYSDLNKRVRSWLQTVTRDTVVVTHGGISRALRAQLLDLDTSAILDLEVPQDKVLEIRRGEMRWL